MNPTITELVAAVPPEEVERRLAEYRRLGFEHQFPAQVVYHGSSVACPWPDCGLGITGIVFHLERMGDPELQYSLMASWWDGPGLVGRCPSCNQFVLFGLTGKQTVLDPLAAGGAVLPDDWHQIAHLVIKPS